MGDRRAGSRRTIETSTARATEAGWIALAAAALAALFVVLAWPSAADAQTRPLRPKCETPVRTLDVSSSGGTATFAAREPLLGCVTPSSGTSFRVRQTCTFHCQHWHTWVATGTPKPANVQLKATPTDGTYLVGWSPNCTPTLGQDRSDCTVRVGANPTTVTAVLSSTPDTMPPTAPGAVTATGESYSAVIRWSPSSGQAGYDIFREDRPGSPVQRVGRGATSATVTNLSCRTAYTFGVEAFDTARNATSSAPIPVTTGRCGPTTRPNTVIHGKPRRTMRSRAAFFHFGVRGEVPATRYECKLDKRRWARCSGRNGKRYRNLKRGYHTFQVRAGNAAGFDRTPAKYRWRIR